MYSIITENSGALYIYVLQISKVSYICAITLPFKVIGYLLIKFVGANVQCLKQPCYVFCGKRT